MAWQESLKQADELYQKGRFQESRELLGATIAELDGQGQQQELSDACLMLGRVSLWLDQLDEAETNLDRARALRSDLHGEESVPVSEVDIWRADLLLARDLKDDAQKTIARAIQVMTDKLGPFNAQVAYGLNTEGVIKTNKKDFASAEDVLNKALGIRRAELGESHRDVGATLNNLSVCHSLTGNLALATPLIKKALQVRQAALGEQHPEVGESLYNLATQHVKQGQYEKALPHARKALEVFKASLPEDHRLVIWTQERLATISLSLGKVDEAERLHKASLAAAEKKWGKDHPHVVSSLVGIGTAFLSKNDFRGAEPFLKRSLEVMERSPELDATFEYNLIQQLSMCYMFQLKPGEVLRLIPASFRAKYTSDFSRTVDVLKQSVDFVGKRIKDMKKDES